MAYDNIQSKYTRREFLINAGILGVGATIGVPALAMASEQSGLEGVIGSAGYDYSVVRTGNDDGNDEFLMNNFSEAISHYEDVIKHTTPDKVSNSKVKDKFNNAMVGLIVSYVASGIQNNDPALFDKALDIGDEYETLMSERDPYFKLPGSIAEALGVAASVRGHKQLAESYFGKALDDSILKSTIDGYRSGNLESFLDIVEGRNTKAYLDKCKKGSGKQGDNDSAASDASSGDSDSSSGDTGVGSF